MPRIIFLLALIATVHCDTVSQRMASIIANGGLTYDTGLQSRAETMVKNCEADEFTKSGVVISDRGVSLDKVGTTIEKMNKEFAKDENQTVIQLVKEHAKGSNRYTHIGCAKGNKECAFIDKLGAETMSLLHISIAMDGYVSDSFDDLVAQNGKLGLYCLVSSSTANPIVIPFLFFLSFMILH